MIDARYNQTDYAETLQDADPLQQYVRALLSRQHALDLLETVHQQINHVWAGIRRLLDVPGNAARRTQAARAARAAQAVQAKNAYRLLEKNRRECIATLRQAESRANAALQSLITSGRKPTLRTGSDFRVDSPNLDDSRLARLLRRKLKNVCLENN